MHNAWNGLASLSIAWAMKFFIELILVYFDFKSCKLYVTFNLKFFEISVLVALSI